MRMFAYLYTLTFKLCVLPMCRHQTGQHFRIRIERRRAIAVRAVEKCEDQARRLWI